MTVHTLNFSRPSSVVTRSMSAIFPAIKRRLVMPVKLILTAPNDTTSFDNGLSQYLSISVDNHECF